MIMKTLPLILLTLLLQSCSSQNNNKMNDYKEKILNINNDIENINNKSLYNFHYRYSGCQIEILINDKLILKEFGGNIGAFYTPIPINHLLSKDNPQKVKVIVKPLGSDYLTEQANFKIGFSYFESNNERYEEYHKDEDKYFLFQFNTHETVEFESFERKINIEGLPFYEKEFEFDSKILIENDFLANARDLRKINQDSLSQNILKKYQQFANGVNNKKNEDLYWEMVYSKVEYFAQANYLDKKSLEDIIKQSELLLNQANFPSIENNYKLTFYDNGKLVCFESTVDDLKLKGKSPLIATATNPNDPKDIYKKPIQFYFYMPKGKLKGKLKASFSLNLAASAD